MNNSPYCLPHNFYNAIIQRINGIGSANNPLVDVELYVLTIYLLDIALIL